MTHSSVEPSPAASPSTSQTLRLTRSAELYTRAVDIVISRLRKKLEPLDAIKTLRNAGYALALRVADDSTQAP